MNLKFIDIKGVDNKIYSVNPLQIVRMYEITEYSMIELSNGEQIGIKMSVEGIKGLIFGGNS